MKHTFLVTLVLVGLFILSQLIGLALIAKESLVEQTPQGIVVNYPDTAMGGRPDTTGGASLLYVVIGIALGTLLVLVLVRFQKINIWRVWFFFAVWMAISISVGVFEKMSVTGIPFDIALVAGAVLAFLKLRFHNMIIHNATEVLMYSGIALLLSPIFDLLWASVLLVVISIYDAYAVWKSKHMVAMAKFQTKSNLFAGMLINYHRPDDETSTKSSTLAIRKAIPESSMKARRPVRQRVVAAAQKATGMKSAILGGGDIAFPLIYSGVVLKWLLGKGLDKTSAFMHANIITVCAALALLGLFAFAKKDKFYPAMPFISAGCFVGLGVLWLTL